ncbi:phage tail protein [Nocardia sp. CA-129566]|uniref:phage tail protein n=1 Tax=Nocardia sp. CA-129566 TaxID=3239976 RepID=UPI003D97E010
MPEPARKPKPPRPPHNPATPVRSVGTANAMQRLQATAGNGAVAALFAQRLSAGEGASACLAPTVAPTPTTPRQDPKFAAAVDHIAAESAAAKAHPAPAKEVKAAQDAATAPADDKQAQAEAAHTATMAAAKPAGFDKAGFIAAVKAAIAAKAPKNLDEADKFAASGKADQVKNEVLGKVGAGKEAAAKNVADTTKATPDTSIAKDKPVTAMPAAPPTRQPVAPDPAAAAPKPAPAEQVRLGAGSCETDAKMAEAGVTDEQLAKSNEPELTGALAAKQDLRAHDATAPAQFRQQEAATLAAAKDQAGASAKGGLAAMGSAKAATLHAAGAGKDATKAEDEAERARITGEIKKIFDATKTEVEKILADLDGLVAKKFEDGERQAKEAFTADHKERMWQYKLRRYGGPLGPTLWVKDLLLDMPAEANNLFLESKKLYETRMSAVIADIADTVGTELGRAKDRIAQGRTQVQKFVAEQPTNLQKLAGRAVGEIGSQFDELEKSVDEKQQSLVDDLATRYAEARDGIDEEIKKLQDENKGLVGKTIDAVGGAIETIKKLKDMLLGVLARAAGAVEKIIKDPIAFLGNFVNAVKAGISNFMSNIGTHLKKGLQGWLFGALAEAGIEIPAKFDLKGIITLLLSLLGLTWNSIRARIVKVVGEPAMQKIEGAVDFVKAIVTEGIPGLWKWIAQKITDLKEQVMGQIREFVITKVITAGITWLISLLNPAAAFIKACKMIYDAVMWFVDNAERLKEFVDSVLDSVESIASGGVGKVAALIEGTLSKTVPMLISGLASLLGLGGIADKIKKILETVQKPVGSVVDKLVAGAVKYGKQFLGKLKGSKASDPRSAEERKSALDAAMAEGQAVLHGKGADEKSIRSRLAAIKKTRQVKTLDLAIDSRTATSETVHIVGANSPTVHGPAVTRERFTWLQRSQSTPTATGQVVTLADPVSMKIAELIKRLDNPIFRPGPHAGPALIALTQQRMLRISDSDEETEISQQDVVGSNPPHRRERRAMQNLATMHGGVICHHCANPVPRVSGNWTVDHIPPSRLLQEIPKDLLIKAGIYDANIATRTYPHCASCQSSQGGLVNAAITLYKEIKAAGGIA